MAATGCEEWRPVRRGIRRQTRARRRRGFAHARTTSPLSTRSRRLPGRDAAVSAQKRAPRRSAFAPADVEPPPPTLRLRRQRLADPATRCAPFLRPARAVGPGCNAPATRLRLAGLSPPASAHRFQRPGLAACPTCSCPGHCAMMRPAAEEIPPRIRPRRRRLCNGLSRRPMLRPLLPGFAFGARASPPAGGRSAPPGRLWSRTGRPARPRRPAAAGTAPGGLPGLHPPAACC